MIENIDTSSYLDFINDTLTDMYNKDLYRHSDSALYISKENGKNQYTVYNSNIQNTKSAVNEIDSDKSIEPKTFASNISEYVFRILYEARDKKSAINSVLELVGKHYNVSRTYIFEDSNDCLCPKKHLQIS